jgi:hypothetical protein
MNGDRMDRRNTFLEAAAEALALNPDWREGQCMFNVLWEMDRDLAETIRAGPLDPFYDDQRIGPFLAWLDKCWPTEDPPSPGSP